MKFSNRTALQTVAVCYFFYLCLRAWKLPVTTDEGTTWFNYVPLSVADLLAYTNPVPNNHVLNTLLIKCISPLFSPHQFTLRLPALLGAAAYLVGTVGIARLLGRRWWLRGLAVAVLLGNHFVADFLCLARGYGMSAGLAMLAVWQSALFLKEKQTHSLFLAMLWSVLSVLASFTALNFFMPFSIILAIVVYQNSVKNKIKWQQWGIIGGATVVLAGLCYLPFKRMSETNQFEFWSTRGFFQDTLLPAVQDFRYNQEMFGANTPHILAGVVVLIFSLSTLVSIQFLIKNKWQSVDALTFVWALLTGTVLMTLLQAWLIRTPYLSGRTALIFYPLLALNLIFLIKNLSKDRILIEKWVSIGMAVLFGWHFANCMNLKSCKEWWFDAHTFEVLDYLKSIKLERNDCRRISLASYWVTNNSLSFAIRYQYEDYVELPVWKDRSDPAETAEFVYTEQQEIPIYQEKYEVVWQRPESGRFLLRRKAE